MSDEKKKSTKNVKEIHVDTLHIHANEVILHNERRDDENERQRQIPRDFWGFPMQQMQQGNDENAGDANDGNENNDGAQQGPPPGWI